MFTRFLTQELILLKRSGYAAIWSWELAERVCVNRHSMLEVMTLDKTERDPEYDAGQHLV